jgi:hypothetical protein
MNTQIMTLENAALERLTNERRESGEISPEVDATLSAIGVFWDEIEQEYFNIELFQEETYERLLTEYGSREYSN